MILRALALTALVWLAGSLPAAADEPDDPYPLVFPVVGEVTVYDNFGDCRSGCGRTHEGVDIMAAKGTPVVAAASGVVDWVTPPGDQDRCCYLGILHDDGWSTRYVHLNNDTPGTDDGLGWGIADGIELGVRVTAGQLIGWVGDSGNAESAGSHLHFELRQPGDWGWGEPVDPYEALMAAPRLDAPGWSGRFLDDDGNTHEANIDIIAEQGITKGCNPPDNTRYCPDDPVTRGQMAAFLRRLLGLPAATTQYFSDIAGTTFEGDINALAEAGIAFGCTATDYCPNTPLQRWEMAELLVRTFGYEPTEIDFFIDDDGHPNEAAIDALAAVGVTKGCNPPTNDRFCPERHMTRAEMATFLARALGLGS